MQLSICCSGRAKPLAGQLAERFRRNLGVDSLLIPEDDTPVSATWEEGTGGDAVLVLLDALSAPPPLALAAWQGLIGHSGEPPVGLVLLEPCAYPKVLERSRFWHGEGWQRRVERWLVSLGPQLDGLAAADPVAGFPEEWWATLADAPGQAETADANAAQAFAHEAAGHFHGVAWIGCAGREPSVIQAELAYRLRGGRMLAVLAHAARRVPVPDSSHSIVHVIGTPPAAETGDAALGACYGPVFPGWLARELGADLKRAVALDERRGLYRLAESHASDDGTRQRHLEIVHRRFAGYRNEPGPCRELLTELPAAAAHGFVHDWQRAVELCRRGADLLLGDGRRREGIRLLHRLLLEAEERGDAETAGEARHELSWQTGDDEPIRLPSSAGVQMDLPF